MIIVDAHPHIYSPDTERYPPIADPVEPGEPAAVEDLRRRMDEAGVARAVFIQTSTYYEWDNRCIMDCRPSAKPRHTGGRIPLLPNSSQSC